MMVTVFFFTSLKEITQKKKDEIELPSSSTLQDLMILLLEKYGRRFKEYVYDEEGRTMPHLQFLINGKNIARLQGFKTTLMDSDAVAIIPPVSGG